MARLDSLSSNIDTTSFPEKTKDQHERLARAGVIELQELFAEKPESRQTIVEMLERVKKENEGKQGMIFKLDVRSLSKKLKKELSDLGIDVSDDRAVKILKVGRRNELRGEFDIHMRAYDALGTGNIEPGNECAAVPKPVLIGEVETPENIDGFLG